MEEKSHTTDEGIELKVFMSKYTKDVDDSDEEEDDDDGCYELVATVCGILAAIAIAVFGVLLFFDNPARLSNSDSGDTMLAVMDAICDRPDEVLAVFDLDGGKVFEYTSSSAQAVDFRAAHRDYMLEHQHELVLLHNHPSGNTFSCQDLVTAAELKVAKMVVVSSDYVYTLEPKHGDWGEPRQIRRRYRANLKYYRNTVPDLRDGGDDESWDRELTVETLADEFDLDYKKSDFHKD